MKPQMEVQSGPLVKEGGGNDTSGTSGLCLPLIYWFEYKVKPADIISAISTQAICNSS